MGRAININVLPFTALCFIIFSVGLLLGYLFCLGLPFEGSSGIDTHKIICGSICESKGQVYNTHTVSGYTFDYCFCKSLNGSITRFVY